MALSGQRRFARQFAVLALGTTMLGVGLSAAMVDAAPSSARQIERRAIDAASLTGSELRDRANTYFGNGEIAQFSEPEALEDLTRLFLIRSQASQVATGAIGRARVALTLLQSMA